MVILSYVLGSCRGPWAPRQPRNQIPEVALDTRPPCLASLSVLVALTGLALSVVSDRIFQVFAGLGPSCQVLDLCPPELTVLVLQA